MTDIINSVCGICKSLHNDIVPKDYHGFLCRHYPEKVKL